MSHDSEVLMSKITLTLAGVVVGCYTSNKTTKEIVSDLMYGYVGGIDLVEEKVLFDEYRIEAM